ncbi:2-amino-4-hydroxy-6-hydroxymethyldihydropteridine diphosphokinase [Desulfovibrio desulfuricans]|jgi:2-amino-4-hydroxy-6-hydroxymethyldihydropteridine diphosphokinase|uniref:2-amino-4-hydroxy-6-hydroxymethyldihydropteridine pyrophosphokinase n=3 Tax=Nitratidesulfovibrio vulgaris TaxID=881 RepID=Q72BI0_NITV2|nr:2-amino-4-hydroxy-6-hydroxymethyldihydropteridine pyrophosphokinase [Nitratidesulfovibrio vulgaris str. Hildenborough]ABM28448.1 2-amino-4-hydroxy-6-hydroxymethyldihydropteridine pyrophosphokinase [Nitratidesulfovibrio vulgaris DP4]ADP86788.1 2-amino-4-hydroxy-6-hydroxymethyldihydropteridine pyrophosphokinase [Nitratidesulfovibrio vulgaris RCH1]GEB79387.1 2-amino-4-hydroxy-6-hydroxymethyldihydropteridine diphosphokinase [Desulfovibrio desulfuricans]
MRDIPGVRVVDVSPSYYTEPQEKRDQPWFANRVARLLCSSGVTPEGLLASLLDIEARLGRRREADAPRFGPRVIDIDLLVFGGEQRDGDVLTLPHPRMAGRAFVLVPLRDVAPDFSFPDGVSLHERLAALPHRVEGRRIWQ